MSRTIWIAVVLVTTAAAVLLRPERQKSDASADASAVLPASITSRDVRVQHRFVSIAAPIPASPEIVSFSGKRVQRRSPSSSASSLAASRQIEIERAREDDALLSKARRAVLGDGRHRPEPFPRVK